MSSAELVCSDVSRAILENVPLDWSIHTIMLLALPASCDVFGCVARVKCPCGAEMVVSGHVAVKRFVQDKMA